MIEQLIVVVFGVSVVFLIGVLFGQHSVWRWLRKKGQVIRDGWCYTVTEVKEDEYKRWD